MIKTIRIFTSQNFLGSLSSQTHTCIEIYFVYISKRCKFNLKTMCIRQAIWMIEFSPAECVSKSRKITTWEEIYNVLHSIKSYVDRFCWYFAQCRAMQRLLTLLKRKMLRNKLSALHNINLSRDTRFGTPINRGSCFVLMLCTYDCLTLWASLSLNFHNSLWYHKTSFVWL